MSAESAQVELQLVLLRAAREGLLPEGTRAPRMAHRPWPRVLLAGVGAWLAALPLLAGLALLLGDWARQGAGPYVAGALLLAGATGVLRVRALPVFAEQLALPVLLAGLGLLGAALFRDADPRGAAALLALLSLALGAIVPRAWLRGLLGAAAAGLCTVAFMPSHGDGGLPGAQGPPWLALHASLALWLMASAAQGRLGPTARASLEPLRAGWVLALLIGLAWASGPSLLLGASLGGSAAGEMARAPWPGGRAESLPRQLSSLLLALAGAAWAARRWPALRRARCGGAALLAAGLAAFMPSLGATLLLLALLVTSGRWRLALAAALAAAWIVGAFYCALDWSLHLKALVLLATGALLGVLSASATAAARSALARQPAAAPHARLGLALTVGAVLAVANAGIWQKETLVAGARPVFVELLPADPRSLGQGDCMPLRFRLPEGLGEPTPRPVANSRPQVLALPDARGVVSLRRAPAAAPAAAGELRIELKPKGGQWMLVTEAWFFAEGQGARWAPARYAEFRVDGQGRARLVGLRDAALRPL